MNKLFLLGSTVLAMVIILKISLTDLQESNQTDWTKYTIKENQVKKGKIQEQEAKLLQQLGGKGKRTIASTPSNRSDKAQRPIERDGRALIGDRPERFKALNTPLTYTNTYNPKWSDHLGKNLLRFMPEETKAYLKKEGSYIVVKGPRGRFIEKVLITYVLPDGRQTSFNASVDSQTGKILETWNRTLYEFDPQRERKIRPTGSIR